VSFAASNQLGREVPAYDDTVRTLEKSHPVFSRQSPNGTSVSAELPELVGERQALEDADDRLLLVGQRRTSP
jgi:hypothetical protein